MVLGRLFSKKWLFLTNTITSGGLLAIGDGLQQSIERKSAISNKYDWARTGRMFLVGLACGPPHHYWYVWLDKVLKPHQVWKKILADQLIAAPFFAAFFFYGMGSLENKTPAEVTTEFRSKFPTVYAFDWFFWPPIQYVNFHYVPSRFRVLYVNGATVVWDVFLSYMKHHDQVMKNLQKHQADEGRIKLKYST
ncbi:mpv17-like protein 2 isoform X1 [Cloeon dipterum]|uniref:mpv17-like protein 2 isoform X1 n=1 Tax=Cloeon dipterum TaxID=197152 RepID=UPI00321F6A09